MPVGLVEWLAASLLFFMNLFIISFLTCIIVYFVGDIRRGRRR